MEVKANLKYIRVSPQKCRLTVDAIRGKKVSDALDILNYSKQKSSDIVKKVLESAIANAEHNNGADIDTLKIKTVYVNVGPTLKRFRARAKGSANQILKRSSHITIGLSDE
ncbi:MAG: 50S ribosomal protein L22 [Gammaproteobacteria bacterium]|jgi:large subunit ribosomal protein L22|nr:50S ribosomal protein L22 [Gammaproteobacteria bacterium]MBT7603567.1 50S ribosomal protein L22 [Gammaproteobacteria bacterium]